MFCYQCEQTIESTGCEKVGACGKDPATSDLHDLLVYALQGLAVVAREASQAGIKEEGVDSFMTLALFSTLTNVNFDKERIAALIQDCVVRRDALAGKIRSLGKELKWPAGPATFTPGSSIPQLEGQAVMANLKANDELNPDIRSLQHTVLFGLKGVAAYAYHAEELGKSDPTVGDFISEALSAMLDRSLTLDHWVQLTLKCGEINLKAMELLDAVHTGTFGHPVPTDVSLGARKGKAILVSGHDLPNLKAILEQTAGTGINVYTHGEMLPAHGYPELKKYPHLSGHFGTAWYNQAREFANFPGAILMNTNCLQQPKESYGHALFTCGPVGWKGVPHIYDQDFSPVIQKALSMPGFLDDVLAGSVKVGFAHNTVLGVADKVIEGVKSGAISHFFVVGGCDGAKSSRNYYEEFVAKTPQDSIVLTLGCAKFRFFDKELGTIGGLPRLLDLGQCNDAYSAIKIAVALANAFNCGVNDLPLSLVLSWYEQKAVSVLLTLFHLGIKGIRLGPTLPAFLTPNVAKLLVETFDLKLITTPDEDLGEIFNRAAAA